MPVKLPISREAHLKALVVSLEMANAILPSPLCADPMLPLVAILSIFRAMLDTPSLALKDKAQIAKAGDYLAKRLATVVLLVDKSISTLAALYNAIPCGEGGGWREPAKALFFGITHGLA